MKRERLGAVERGLLERLSAPVDGAWLAAFRCCFGLTLCVSMLRFLAYGWIEVQFTRPTFHFKYWGTSWLPALPDALLPPLFAALAGLALAIGVGLYFRAAAALFVIGFAYVQLFDATNYLNHYYLALLLALLLAVSPAGQSYSIDAWRQRRRGLMARAAPTAPRSEIAAAWLWLFRLQVGLVYFFAGIGKLQSDWLLSGQPLGIWLASRADLPVVGAWLAAPGVPLVMSWAGFAFDTTVPLWLSWHKTRPWAYAVSIAFHAATGVLFPIGMFPVIMVLSALVFFPPDWPRALLSRARGVASSAVSSAAADASPPLSPVRPRLPRWALSLGAAYCALQLLLPLRAFAYGGNVAWHEQGMRWSWRVMLREKNGSVTFRVRSRETGRIWEVSPTRYLTRLQEREMSGQPELIWQLAKHIRADFEQRGLGPVAVHADAWVSLNGRRAERLVDPDVDLTEAQGGLAPAAWILPAPATGAGPAARPLAERAAVRTRAALQLE